MGSYVKITKGHKGIIKAMKIAVDRLKKDSDSVKPSGDSMCDLSVTLGMAAERDRCRSIGSMMMFEEEVHLNASDADFLVRTIKDNKGRG